MVVRAMRSLIAGLLLTGLAAGCSSDSADPAPAATSSSATPTPSVTSTPTPTADTLTEALAQYNPRQNAAIQAATQYDSSKWAEADKDAVLEADRYRTKEAELEKRQEISRPFDYMPQRQLGAPASSGSRWVMGVAQFTDPTSAPPTTTPADDFDISVVVLDQAAPDQPWLMTHHLDSRTSDLPTDTTTMGTTPEQDKAAVVAVKRVNDWLSTGTGAEGLDLGKDLPGIRNNLINANEDYARATLTCGLYHPVNPASGQSPSVRSVRVGTSTLAAATMKCTQVMYAAEGDTLTWKDGWEKVYKPDATDSTLTQPRVMGALIVIPDGGTPKVIGVSDSDAL